MECKLQRIGRVEFRIIAHSGMAGTYKFIERDDGANRKLPGFDCRLNASLRLDRRTS